MTVVLGYALVRSRSLSAPPPSVARRSSSSSVNPLGIALCGLATVVAIPTLWFSRGSSVDVDASDAALATAAMGTDASTTQGGDSVTVSTATASSLLGTVDRSSLFEGGADPDEAIADQVALDADTGMAVVTLASRTPAVAPPGSTVVTGPGPEAPTIAEPAAAPPRRQPPQRRRRRRHRRPPHPPPPRPPPPRPPPHRPPRRPRPPLRPPRQRHRRPRRPRRRRSPRRPPSPRPRRLRRHRPPPSGRPSASARPSATTRS